MLGIDCKGKVRQMARQNQKGSFWKRLGLVLALAVAGLAPALDSGPAFSAAALLPNGEQTFVDANGLPLAGGSVYFYVPSTTTLSPTWKDAGQVVQNSNPVVLDSAGRAIIFGVGTYRQVVKDVLGNTIWDQPTQSFSQTSAASFASTVTGLPGFANPSLFVGQLVTVSGYAAAGDGGGGLFLVTTNNPGSNDGCINVYSATTGYYFVKQVLGQALDIRACGAIADNATANQTAINKALSVSTNVCVPSTPLAFKITAVLVPIANTTFSGCGSGVGIINGGTPAAAIVDVEVNNVTVKNLRFIGGWTGGVKIGATVPVSNTIVSSVVFDNSALPNNSINDVWLWNATNTWVDQCQMIATEYGIIQQNGTTVTTVKITRNVASDMYADMINFNGAAGTATDILIEDNSFLGSHIYPAVGTEVRFMALTAGGYSTIRGNFVTHVSGDAAIHLENGSGALAFVNINKNTFVDNNVSGGNNGIIYVLSSLENILVEGNYFIQVTHVAGSATVVVDECSGSYGNQIVYEGNFQWVTSATHDFGGFCLNFFNGDATISNNFGYGLSDFVTMISVTGTIKLAGNRLLSANNGIISTNIGTGGGSGGNNIHLESNSWDCGTWCIHSGQNNGATGSPNDWTVTGNWFTSSFGAHNGVQISSCIQCWAASNYYDSMLTNTTVANGPGANTVEKNDFKAGTGLIHP